jgi:hypothetical protein
MWEITPEKSASVYERVRFTWTMNARCFLVPMSKRYRSQSVGWRLFAQVDFRREMRPIAFVDPGAFIGTNLQPTVAAGLPAHSGADHAYCDYNRCGPDRMSFCSSADRPQLQTHR